MDHIQQIVVMAADDARWGPRDARGRRRQLTADEPDALAGLGWNLPDLRKFFAALANAARSLRRSARRLPSGAFGVHRSSGPNASGATPA